MPTDTTPALPASAYKCGNEFAPYHRSASHVEPAYRDGWNHCFKAAAERITAALARAAELERERDELRRERMAWLVENGPGGWIDNLRRERDALRADAVRYRIGAHGSCKRADGSELGMCWVAWVNPGGAGSIAKIEWVSDADVDAAIIKHLESVNLQAQEYAYAQEYARAVVAAVPMLPNSDLGHQSGTGGEAPSLTEPLPGTLEGAYAEGRSDEREAFRDVLRHLERPAEGWTLNTLLRAVEAAQKAAES